MHAPDCPTAETRKVESLGEMVAREFYAPACGSSWALTQAHRTLAEIVDRCAAARISERDVAALGAPWTRDRLVKLARIARGLFDYAMEKAPFLLSKDAREPIEAAERDLGIVP